MISIKDTNYNGNIDSNKNTEEPRTKIGKTEETDIITEEESNNKVKTGNSPGIDNVMTEMIKYVETEGIKQFTK